MNSDTFSTVLPRHFESTTHVARTRYFYCFKFGSPYFSSSRSKNFLAHAVGILSGISFGRYAYDDSIFDRRVVSLLRVIEPRYAQAVSFSQFFCQKFRGKKKGKKRASKKDSQWIEEMPKVYTRKKYGSHAY